MLGKQLDLPNSQTYMFDYWADPVVRSSPYIEEFHGRNVAYSSNLADTDFQVMVKELYCTDPTKLGSVSDKQKMQTLKDNFCCFFALLRIYNLCQMKRGMSLGRLRQGETFKL